MHNTVHFAGTAGAEDVQLIGHLRNWVRSRRDFRGHFGGESAAGSPAGWAEGGRVGVWRLGVIDYELGAEEI